MKTKTNFDIEVKQTSTDNFGDALGLPLETSKMLFDRFVGVVKHYLETDLNVDLATMLYGVTALGNTQAEAVMLAYGFGKIHEVEMLFFGELDAPMITPPETNPWINKPIDGETLLNAYRIPSKRVNEIIEKSMDIVELIQEDRMTKESDQVLALLHTCKDMNELLFMSYSYGFINRATDNLNNL